MRQETTDKRKNEERKILKEEENVEEKVVLGGKCREIRESYKERKQVLERIWGKVEGVVL